MAESIEHKDPQPSTKPAAPAAKTAEPAPKDPPPMVTLCNKLPQRLAVSLDRGNGPEEIVLWPHGSSAPIAEDHLTEYTRGIIERGFVRKRAAGK